MRKKTDRDKPLKRPTKYRPRYLLEGFNRTWFNRVKAAAALKGLPIRVFILQAVDEKLKAVEEEVLARLKETTSPFPPKERL